MPRAVVLEDPLSDLGVAPDQGRTGAAAHEPDTGPEIRGDLEVGRRASVEGSHPPLSLGLARGQAGSGP